MKFDQMNLPEPLLRALIKMGFESPTPIQEQTIPALLEGKDIIGQAQTGTGKTASFGLPALVYCIKRGAITHHRGVASPHVLMLAPTRELAVQIAAEMDRMGEFTPIRTVCVYGGQDIERQLRAFEQRVDIVVGTPGRLLDHIERGSLNLSGVQFVVLDEADRMLDMGFIDDIVQILQKTNPQKQMMLFSATMPREIENIAYDYMKNPESVKVSEDKLTVDKIAQKFVVVDGRNRMGYLYGFLTTEKPALALVFARTKMSAEKLADILSRRGIETDCLHGDMRQGARDRAIKKFKEGHLKVLVATDLAARGLDVFNVSHVINYDLPMDFETYIHRIGRTGRMGETGIAISFVFEDQMDWMRDLVKFTKIPVEQINITPVELPRPAFGHGGGQGHFGGERRGFGREGSRDRHGGGERRGGDRHGGREGGHREGGHSSYGGSREGGRSQSGGRFGNRRGGRDRHSSEGPRQVHTRGGGQYNGRQR